MMNKRPSSLLRRLWQGFLNRYRGRLGLAFLFMVGLAVTEAAFVLITEWIFSGFDPSPDRRFAVSPETVMIWGPILVIGLGSAQAFFFYLQQVASQNVAIRTLRDLQKAMFAEIGTFDLAQTADDGSGQLMSRFTNDMTILREGLTRAPNGVRDLVRLIGFAGILAYQDWVLFLSVLLIYPIVGVPITWIGGKIRRVARKVQQQIGDMTGLLSETLRGQRMVKTYQLEAYEADRLGSAFDDRYHLLNRLIKIRAANEPLITVVGAVAIAAIIGIAALRIDLGLLTGPELVSFLVGMALLSQPARGLGTLNAVIQEGLSALERVFDVLDREPAIMDCPQAANLSITKGSASIELKDVTFGYDPQTPVIENLSLKVPAGQTVALVGPSGAGKSSIFNLLPRLYDPQNGRILIADQDSREVTVASLRQAIGFVSQDAILFDDTVEANIRFGQLDAPPEAVVASATSAAAHDFIQGLPMGYQTHVGEGGGELSGGQRQRIALARAFLKNAPILLLDEATAALDAQSERLIEEALINLSKDRTTLVIAHRLSTIRHADLICVMDKGRIVEQGRHDELVTQNGLYARLVALQFREDNTT
ncbi:MAG: ABC transporter ATP-binding protein [Pseudomonadota bacterium]